MKKNHFSDLFQEYPEITAISTILKLRGMRLNAQKADDIRAKRQKRASFFVIVGGTVEVLQDDKSVHLSRILSTACGLKKAVYRCYGERKYTLVTHVKCVENKVYFSEKYPEAIEIEGEDRALKMFEECQTFPQPKKPRHGFSMTNYATLHMNRLDIGVPLQVMARIKHTIY